MEVLVEQLGHRPAEAKEMVDAAVRRKPGINTPEELFDEVYRGQVNDRR
jgi:Holliday junction DNA helicase RuvA